MINAVYQNYLADSGIYVERVREEWKKFIETGATSGSAVRGEVLNSWRLSMENGLSPDGLGAELVFDEKTMNKINRKSSMLISAADSVIDEFAEMFGKLGANNCVINLCNEDTVILRTVTCGADGEEYAAYQQIVPGAILDEKHTGTTGVSLVRATNLPYALYGPEHYRHAARNCSCAAAPITNIRSNQLKGIIALSGEAFEIVPDTIGMVTFIARTIESNLLLDCLQNENAIMEQFRTALKRGESALIVAVDSDLNVIASSSNFHPMLHGALSIQQLDKQILAVAKKTSEKYLLGAVRTETEKASVCETEGYQVELRPVFRDEVFAGMILLLRDMVSGDMASAEAPAKSDVARRCGLIGRSPAFLSAVETAISVAPTDAPVMLLGETGSGKEVFAKVICENSARAKGKPFFAINCGALPHELIGSELFGYAAGAFTGASQKGKMGKLEAAHTGTIFLDELGAMPLDAQSWLLRVIEEKQLYRIGSTKPVKIDVRIICATNENLLNLIEAKQFRSDLYYRLNVVEIQIPPLRERLDDFPELISQFNAEYGGETCSPSAEDIAYIGQYAWPGNVRELKNVLHSASVLKSDPIAALRNYVAVHMKSSDRSVATFPLFATDRSAPDRDDLSELERVIAACGGNIAKAARQLGVARSTIYRRIQRNL